MKNKDLSDLCASLVTLIIAGILVAGSFYILCLIIIATVDLFKG